MSLTSVSGTDAVIRHQTRTVRVLAGAVALFLVWAWVFPLTEVSSGGGTVVPSSREQVIQSLDGGILASLAVHEGDVVDAGELLARLDPTRSASNVEEAEAKYYAAIATAARLRAEIAGEETITFPPELDGHDDLKRTESALFASRRNGMNDALAGMTHELELVRQELEITRSLQSSGASSRVELISLEREAAKTEMDIANLKADRLVKAGEELQNANAEAEVQSSVVRGRSDQLQRLTFRAPMRGVVKDIAVTTIGGVVPPNGSLMTIVPIDDQLLIEAKISPRDIAFIHPGQEALVKVSAYDYSIFGGMKGAVTTISPNTVRDEVKPEIVYYRVYIRTDSDHLTNKAGTVFPIVPGMIATVDIRTGEKTVWQYLIKPFNRAREALRER
ncbi:adhesin transport system membrane fusion protein [Rhodobacter sp. 140A]|uniref:Type I secretion system membrane fusion protein PrsE n=1 Tax=bioreactor metagenome TaxID=1076179 RepID=A0A644UY74_9ZZZZ|nr:adhesin transport system membrane fusion protein [Rhodobacter sp. 140A]